ncbi:MAG: CotH kinase family protein [Bacteroidales bacterium]|nr:CotH kinase family protein [Bacteroidales bacterium]
MSSRSLWFSFAFFAIFIPRVFAQVVINEGSNMNYSTIADEDGEYPDWLELYNTGADTINLLNYSITDKPDNPTKWIFPNVKLAPGAFRTVLCSGKDRKPLSGFVHVFTAVEFNPIAGWNTHSFSTPFYWDGISNILINTCSYSSAGYTTNSVFNQTATGFYASSFTFNDGSAASCMSKYGSRAYQRPNMKLNGIPVGTGTLQNSPTDYPAPYGNWYWSARHQMLILASELTAAGLTAGEISSLAFDVVSTDPNTVYDYIDIHMKLISLGELASSFDAVDTSNFLHTNFKISESGEAVFLFSPYQVFLSSLFIECNDLDNSRGSFPDGSSDQYLFQLGTPSFTNNTSATFTDYFEAPVFSVPSGIYQLPFYLSISNPNAEPSSIHYTTDGSEPTPFSQVFTGEPINIANSMVLKARVFGPGILPSPNTVSSYLFGVNHTTPVISVATSSDNLYGENGIFDNWWFDWEKAAYVEYFDSTKNLIFSQRAGIQIDGGWGGARSHPQHSFRVELADGVLGDGPVDYQIIPAKPDRTRYSKFYLRNGSNQYLSFPYKDACQVALMGAETYNYYNAWRPVSVYINGNYFGLYELREKMDTEYFETLDGADPEQTDILSMSAWYGGVLRAVEGSLDDFYEDYASFLQINPSDTSFWNSADQYFDMTWYNDYFIAESWMGNTDWPWNNIKIYRSDKTDFRWRYCLIDLELSMDPNGWTDCYFDHIEYMLNYGDFYPHVHIWQRSILNARFRNYFINRFADVMNTAYHFEKMFALEQSMFNQMVLEMPDEYARWGDPNNIPGQMEVFTNNHLEFQSQLSQRTNQVRNHLQSHFNLPGQVEVILNVYPENAGKIKISTVTPDSYPWQGVYFDGIPVKIEALPEDGFIFLEWGNNGLINNILNPVFLDTLNTGAQNIAFDAYFEELTTSVTKPADRSEFSIYPNPAKNLLSIISNEILTGDLHYQIIDLSGKIVITGTFSAGSNATEILISSLSPSVYLLQITDQKEAVQQLRFVKMGED